MWIGAPTCSPHSQLFYIHLHPSLCVIYLSVRGRIDSPLYSRPLKPGGDSPCQAAGSNEKLKEHINSSIWGHEDENSCQRPARNNGSHNAALWYVSEVTRVKQQQKTQGGENTESWEALMDGLHWEDCVSSSKQAINMSCSKLRLERRFHLVLSMNLKAIRQHFSVTFEVPLILKYIFIHSYALMNIWKKEKHSVAPPRCNLWLFPTAQMV